MPFWKRLFGSADRPAPPPELAPPPLAPTTAALNDDALRVLRIDPGVSSPRVLQGHDALVWLAAAHRACLVALDPRTGEERQLLELDLPDEQAYGLFAHRCAGVWIVESRDELAGFDAEAERRLWRTPRPPSGFRLAARGASQWAADDAAPLFWVCPDAGGAEVRRLDPRTGAWASLARLPFAFVDLFHLHGRRLLVGHAEHGLSCVDVSSGTTHWTVRIPEAQRGDDVLGPVVAGERAWIFGRSWSAGGPQTTMSPVSLDGRGVGAAHRFDGALAWACCSRDLIGLVLTHPQRERVVTALIPGGPRAELVVPEALGPIGLVADEEAIVVVASGGRVALAAPGPTGIAWTEAALPPGVSAHGVLVDGVLACADAHELLLVDTRALRGASARAPRLRTRVVSTAARPAASGSTEPAEVVFSGSSSVVLVEHPRFGRIPLSVAPGHSRPLKGDKVALEELTEKPGGVIEVHRWRLLDAEPTAPGVPVVLQADWREPLRDKPFVRGDLLERLGERSAPPLLRRIFEQHDRDAAFRWLCEAATGLRWQVAADEPGLDAVWEAGAFPFAVDEDGHLFGVGERVVAYDPSSGVVADESDELEAFLRERMERAADLAPSAVRAFRESIGLTA